MCYCRDYPNPQTQKQKGDEMAELFTVLKEQLFEAMNKLLNPMSYSEKRLVF